MASHWPGLWCNLVVHLSVSGRRDLLKDVYVSPTALTALPTLPTSSAGSDKHDSTPEQTDEQDSLPYVPSPDGISLAWPIACGRTPTKSRCAVANEATVLAELAWRLHRNKHTRVCTPQAQRLASSAKRNAEGKGCFSKAFYDFFETLLKHIWGSKCCRGTTEGLPGSARARR
jgi:hypothetical protein